MSEESKILNNAVEFIDFIISNQELKEKLQQEFHQIKNMESLRKTLDVRPCSCGGVNPDAVLAERRSHFERYCFDWMKSLAPEDINSLKASLGEKITLKHGDEVLI